MKKGLVILSITSGIVAMTGALLFNGSRVSTLKLEAAPRGHTVYLTADNSVVNSGTYDADYWKYPITITRNNAFQDSSGGYQPMSTYDDIDFTYLCCGKDAATFGGDALITFTCTTAESIQITMPIKDAILDEEASFISFYHGSTYNNSAKFEYFTGDSDFDYYIAEASFGSYYGQTIKISEIKLAFECLE